MNPVSDAENTEFGEICKFGKIQSGHVRESSAVGVLFRLVSNFRDSDTFRISKARCSFPIAIAPKLLQYGCCNFVGVFNTTDWPICALNIGQNKIFVFFVGLGAGPGETGRFPYGA